MIFSMKKILLGLITAFLLMSCSQTTTLKTPNQSFSVEKANTDELRSIGLMGRESLAAGHGMIFEFEQPDMLGFWMRNTLIPLDIIWISADKKIVDIQTVAPCLEDPCTTYFPKESAQFVLEVNANEFSGAIGDSVQW